MLFRSRQTEPENRVIGDRLSGRRRVATGPGHEVRAGPDGARSHTSPKQTGHRETGGTGRRTSGPTSEGYPNYPFGAGPGGVSCDGTGNRVSVNGVEGPTWPGNRQSGVPTPAAESASAGEAVGDSGNGGRFAGQPGRGGTVIGQPMWRREATEPGSPGRPGLDSGDGGRFAGRRSRSGTHCRVRSGGCAERQQGRVRPVDWPKTGIARRVPLGIRRAM